MQSLELQYHYKMKPPDLMLNQDTYVFSYITAFTEPIEKEKNMCKWL